MWWWALVSTLFRKAKLGLGCSSLQLRSYSSSACLDSPSAISTQSPKTSQGSIWWRALSCLMISKAVIRIHSILVLWPTTALSFKDNSGPSGGRQPSFPSTTPSDIQWSLPSLMRIRNLYSPMCRKCWKIPSKDQSQRPSLNCTNEKRTTIRTRSFFTLVSSIGSLICRRRMWRIRTMRKLCTWMGGIKNPPKMSQSRMVTPITVKYDGCCWLFADKYQYYLRGLYL